MTQPAPACSSVQRLLTSTRYVATSAVCVLISLCLVSSMSLADSPQEQSPQKKAAPRQRAVNPAMVPIEEQPGLPRVLLIGDSISIGYTLPVRELLKDKANVIRPLTNCGPTTRGVEQIDAWLGEGPWDVIHFNFGLHDLVYYSADGSQRLVSPDSEGARHQVPLDQYEKNLRQLVARLKKTQAVLIWCTTTPVPAGTPGRRADEAVEFNQVAERVMKDNDVLINDLHAFAEPRLEKIQLPQNVHFTPEGSAVLAQQVARSISGHLPKR